MSAAPRVAVVGGLVVEVAAPLPWAGGVDTGAGDEFVELEPSTTCPPGPR